MKKTPALIPDDELERIEANFRDEPDFDLVALVAEVRMLRAMLLDTMELHETEERRAIVAWLRLEGVHDDSVKPSDVADDIERGAHRK